MLRLIDHKTHVRLMVLLSLGAVPPLGLMLGHCSGAEVLNDFPVWTTYLWPTVIMMLGASGSSCPDAYFLYAAAISLVANIVLWVSIGFMLCWILIDIPWRRLIVR
jgi:hypothetical protein